MPKLTPTYTNATKDLQEAQKADHDGRIKARAADHFINKKDGQWQPEVIKLYDSKPRYTIDLTSGLVAEASGEMASMDFDIKVRPAGGPATTQIAMHYDGLIRNIENNSGAGAKYIYRAAGKQMLTTGIGGWEIKQGYRSPTSFDQDLIIGPISNFMDRVWYDPGAEFQDMSDADWGFKLTTMSKPDYDRDFPKGSGMSLCMDRDANVYTYKKDSGVTVGQYSFKKYESVELVRMTDKSVFLVDEKFDMVKDELAQQGITVEKTRKTKVCRIHQIMMDGNDFLNDAQETVFSYVPYIPVFGNYEISEDKVIYWGLVEKHMDPQRILNYIESRKVSEGALAPRAKKWMTPEQATGQEKELRTLNTNDDPVQFYNFIPDQPQPFETGGAQINPGLSETAVSMKSYMTMISGRVDPSGDTPTGLQSGTALQSLQNKGDVSNVGYFMSMEIAIAHTCRVLGDAIPRVYDAQREIQIDAQDGTNKTITINQRVFDQQSGQVIELNDFSKGVYSFICSAGPSFHNRQEETIAAFEKVAAIDPSIMQTGGDIYLANIPAPGMPKMAKRRRAQMVSQGLIPQDELTDEEQQQVAAQQEQGSQPSPLEQAQLGIMQAEQEKAQAGTADIMSKMEERNKKFMLEQQKLQLQASKQRDENFINLMKAQDEQIKMMAETLNTIKDAMGADSIIGPSNTEAYKQQSNKLLSTIETS